MNKMKKLFGRGKAMPGTAAVEAASAVEVGYEKLFFRKCDTKTRSGKVVYIRKEHHDRILKIVRVIGENEFSLFNYLDNVLENHFSTYQDEITELYRKKNTDVFN